MVECAKAGYLHVFFKYFPLNGAALLNVMIKLSTVVEPINSP